MTTEPINDPLLKPRANLWLCTYEVRGNIAIPYWEPWVVQGMAVWGFYRTIESTLVSYPHVGTSGLST